jgi:hypothetical protein
VHHAVYVEERNAQTSVPVMSFFEAEFEEFGVDKSSYERRAQGLESEFVDELFYLFAYLGGEVFIDVGFADESIDYALGVEEGEVFV